MGTMLKRSEVRRAKVMAILAEPAVAGDGPWSEEEMYDELCRRALRRAVEDAEAVTADVAEVLSTMSERDRDWYLVAAVLE